MILVVVGTHEQAFDRLIREVDRLVAADALPDEVFCQIGYGVYVPRHTPYARMVPYAEMQERTKTASVVVTHGGPGCILPALDATRPVVLVPRNHAFGEHVDDHQLAFCRRIGEARGCPVVEEIADLEDAIHTAFTAAPTATRRAGGTTAVARLAAAVDDLLAERER